MEQLKLKLICPECRAELRKESDELRCGACESAYKIVDGIPAFCGTDEFYEGKFDVSYDDSQSFFTRPAFFPLFIRKALFRFLILNQIGSKRKKFILDKARGNELTLDIGCGGGRKWLRNYGQVVGIDVSLSSLKNARQIYNAVAQSTLEKLPFPDDYFDVVTGIDILGHIENDDKDAVLTELKRVLKPGGRLVAIVEADSDSVLFRWAKKHKELYYEKFIELDGHFGLEPPAEVIKRLNRLGYKISYKKSVYGIVLPTWEYKKAFAGGYSKKSLFIRALTTFNRSADRMTCRGSRMLVHMMLGFMDSLTMRITGFDNGHILFVEAVKER